MANSPDYVVRSEPLLVGLNIDAPTNIEFWQLGQELQKRNLFLQRFDAGQDTDGFAYGYYGPAGLTVGAIQDFAHTQDVADAVAQAFQALGAPVSNQAAAILGYVGSDITTAETGKFTKAASDSRIFQPPPNPWAAGADSVIKLVDDTAKAASSQSNWLMIGGVILAVVVASSLIKGR